MPTLAYSAYGTQMRLSDGTPLAPMTLVSATNATPIVVTTSAPHGIAIGEVSYGTVTGVGGNTAANGSWIVEATGLTTLELRNSVGNGTYTAGGTLTLAGNFAYIVELTDVQNAGSSTELIDTSAHDGSGYSSQIPTLKHVNQIQLNLNFVPGNPTHDELTGLMSLYASGVYRDWLLVLPPYPGTGQRSVGHIYGGVTYYTFGLPVNNIVAAQCTLAFDGGLDWTQ